MPKAPTESIVYTISLYDASVHVKCAYYEGGRLSAVSGNAIKIPADHRSWKRRLTDLFGVEESIRRAVRMWVDQLEFDL